MSLLDQIHDMIRSNTGRLSKTRVIMAGNIMGMLADELDGHGQTDAADMIRAWRAGRDADDDMDEMLATAWADVRHREVEA